MPKDTLFELVKSLSRSEKRYFKLNSSIYSDKKNGYVKMFDLINSQEKYDEHKVKEKIKATIHPDNFAVEKNYLYNALLKSLTSFHNQKSLNSKASSSLFTISMLIDKALYDHAIKLISKTQRYAEKSENYTLLLEILKLKVNYYETVMNNEEITNTFQYLFKIQKIYTNLEEYRFLHHRIYEKVVGIGTQKRELLIHETEQIINESVLLKNEKEALCIEAKIRFNECWLLYYYLKNDFKAAYKHSKKSLQLSDSAPYYIKEKRDNYISNLNNYLIFCNALKKYDEVEEKIKQLKSFLTKDINSKSNINIFMGVSLQETNLLTLNGKYKDIYHLLDYYKTYLNLFDSKLVVSHKYGLIINISILLFLNNDFRTSLKWLNQVIHNKEPKTRTDVVSFAWFFNMVLHFELKNYDYLEYLVPATTKFLEKKNQLAKTASYVGESILKLSITPKKKQTDIYSKLLDKLSEPECTHERNEIDYLNISYWVISKIKSIPLAKVIKDNV